MSIASALLAVQKDAPPIAKDATNPHYRSKYVSLDTLLEQIVPVLNRHGVVLIQHPTHDNGHPALLTKLVDSETGEAEVSTMLLMASKPDPQGQGSAITYARRYALMAALGLSADEDDDGNAASRPAREKPGREAVDYATPEQNKAIVSEQNRIRRALGDAEARDVYEKALAKLGITPGEPATTTLAAQLITLLKSYEFPPASPEGASAHVPAVDGLPTPRSGASVESATPQQEQLA